MYTYIHTYIRAFQTVCRKAQVKVDDSEENSSTGNPNHSPMRKSSSNYLPTISRSSSSTSISIYIHTYINTYVHTYTYYGALNILKVVDSELSSPQKSALDIYNVSLHTYIHTSNIQSAYIHAYIHTYIHTYIHIPTGIIFFILQNYMNSDLRGKKYYEGKKKGNASSKFRLPPNHEDQDIMEK